MPPRGRRPDRRDARDRAVRLPRVRLVAVAHRPRRQAALDREGRGRVGRVGHRLPRRRRAAARLDAVRAGRALPARGRAAGRAAVAATRCSSRARTSSTPATPWVMQSLFLAAIGDAKDRGAKALEAFAYRYREGESAYERFLVHRTVFPSRLPRGLRLPHGARRRAASSWRGSSSAGSCPSRRGCARRSLRALKAALSRRPVPQRAVIAEIVDLERYPLDAATRRGVPRGAARARARSSSTASSGRRRSSGWSRTRTRLAARGYPNDATHNAYFDDEIDESLPDDHPRRILVRSAQKAVAMDLLPADFAPRAIYDSEEMHRFVAAVLEKDVLYRADDPLDGCNLTVYEEGDELGWHFDQSEFSVTLMIQRSSAAATSSTRRSSASRATSTTTTCATCCSAARTASSCSPASPARSRSSAAATRSTASRRSAARRRG